MEDGNIIKPAELEKFFHDRVKVGGKANTGKVTVSRNATRVTVSAPAPFSKRYVKYLTKKVPGALRVRRICSHTCPAVPEEERSS